MLAILYLLIALAVGNLFCRRLFTFTSSPHRIATNLLVGLLVCTLPSYLLALAFSTTGSPMAYANLCFFVIGLLVLFPEIRETRSIKSRLISYVCDENTSRSDWIWAAAFLVFTAWLMFGTFSYDGNNLKIGAFLWNDFGPNLSLIQSFAVGQNFPAQYPHFIGEPIRYHFLFWFQAGNLEFLGLDIAWSLNILSTVTMTSMLVLIVAFGQTVFNSKAVGRLAACMFFFHGSLSYIPFLWTKDSFADAYKAVVNVSEWIPSIYKYAGEQWGVWSMGTFLAQRHLPASIGFFLVVFIALLQSIVPKNEEENGSVETNPSSTRKTIAFVVAGLLLGLIPLWNGAVFVAGFAVIAASVFLFKEHLRIIMMLAAASVVAVPQILSLRAAGNRGFLELFRWGYVVDPPTVSNVLQYFAFTFGPKFLLAAVALIFLSNFHRCLFLAITSLLILAFSTQLSTDVMNNHKFLNLWLILLNAYVSYMLIVIWRQKIAGKIAAVLIFVFISFGGAIELIRIWNVNDTDVPYGRGAIYEWLEKNTKPTDTFLTDHYVHSPILLSGRRIFYGWQYFGWSMGYPTGERDQLYRRLLTGKDAAELVRSLQDNNIQYVVIDQGLRTGYLKNELNEWVFVENFEKVFSDQNGSMAIYRVP